MATLNKVDRARYIMDLIKDGEVVNLADYINVEKFAPARALVYAQAFWDFFPHPELFEIDGTTPRDPTNSELASHHLNRLRIFHKEVRASARISTAVEITRETEVADAAIEGTTDLDDNETVE